MVLAIARILGLAKTKTSLRRRFPIIIPVPLRDFDILILSGFRTWYKKNLTSILPTIFNSGNIREFTSEEEDQNGLWKRQRKIL